MLILMLLILDTTCLIEENHENLSTLKNVKIKGDSVLF